MRPNCYECYEVGRYLINSFGVMACDLGLVKFSSLDAVLLSLDIARLCASSNFIFRLFSINLSSNYYPQQLYLHLCLPILI